VAGEMMMMMSISRFGPVGCGRPIKGARRGRHTTAHNPCGRRESGGDRGGTSDMGP
jgi:hypothetical protein